MRSSIANNRTNVLYVSMGKHTLARLQAQLRDSIDDLPPRLGAVAKYILDHPVDFGLDPIRVSAEKIGVSANTLVRLAQHLGLDGFNDLRAPFRSALMTDRDDLTGEDWVRALENGGPASATQGRLVRNEMNIVARSLRRMDVGDIEKAVSLLTTSRNGFVTATRASYALAAFFHYVGRMAVPSLELIPRHMGCAVDELMEANAEDVLLAITFAPYSADTIQAIRFARKKGARIILVADSAVIAPGIEPDVFFQVETNSLYAFGSFCGAMAVLECLLGHLMDAGGVQAQKRLIDYEEAREVSGAYWRARPYKFQKR